jgi:hypothetical protein
MPPGTAKPPHPGDLIKLIRKLAREGKYSFSSHALDERMEDRDIDADDVLHIFALGDISGAIEPGKRPGEWRCLVVSNLPWTSREAGVVTVVVRNERIIIVTVEWIDP